MTENDKQLIQQALATSRWSCYDIEDHLIPQAETPEARRELYEIMYRLYDAAMDSL